MFFLSMLIGVSLVWCSAYSSEQAAPEITISAIETIASKEGFDGLKRLLSYCPEQKEWIRILVDELRERGSVGANGETEHALFDFCKLLADSEFEQ